MNGNRISNLLERIALAVSLDISLRVASACGVLDEAESLEAAIDGLRRLIPDGGALLVADRGPRAPQVEAPLRELGFTVRSSLFLAGEGEQWTLFLVSGNHSEDLLEHPLLVLLFRAELRSVESTEQASIAMLSTMLQERERALRVVERRTGELERRNLELESRLRSRGEGTDAGALDLLTMLYEQSGGALGHNSMELQRCYQEACEMIADRDRAIEAYEKSVVEKIELIKKLENTLDERWKIMEEYERALTAERAKNTTI